MSQDGKNFTAGPTDRAEIILKKVLTSFYKATNKPNNLVFCPVFFSVVSERPERII